MKHKIEFVDDDALPEGHDFMFVASDTEAVIFYRRSKVTPANLEDSWAAYRAMREGKRLPPSSLRDSPGRHLSAVSERRLA